MCGLQLMGRRQDGSVFALSLSLSEVLDKGDNQRRFVGVMRDLTEIEKLNSELQEQSSQLEAILNSTVDSIVTCDVNSKILAYNTAAGMRWWRVQKMDKPCLICY